MYYNATENFEKCGNIMELLIQALGLLGMVMNLVSFQLKEQKKLIRLQFYSSIVFSAHYLLLGATMGAILNMIGICRAFVFSNKEKPWAQKKGWLPAFIAVYVVVYLLTFTVFGKERTLYNILLELLPVIGMTATTIGFRLENATKVRLLSLTNAPTWLVYNILNGSAGGALTEIFCLISVVVGILRLDIKKLRKE